MKRHHPGNSFVLVAITVVAAWACTRRESQVISAETGSDVGSDSGTDSNGGTGSDGGIGSDSGGGCSSCDSCSAQIYGDQDNQIGDSVQLVAGIIPDMLYPLSFTASGLPPGLAIDSSSGTISGVVAVDALTDAPYTVTVDAKDSTQPLRWVTRITFDWWIREALHEELQQNSVVGDPVAVQLPAPDDMTAPVSVTATGLPSGLTMSTSGLVTGTTDVEPDTYPVVVDTVDASSPPKAATYAFEWVVSPRPTLDQWTFVGEYVSFTPPASGTPPFAYMADGLPPGLAIDLFTGEISGVVQSGTELGSPYPVVVTVMDSTGDTTTVVFQWVVSLWDTTSITTTPPL